MQAAATSLSGPGGFRSARTPQTAVGLVQTALAGPAPLPRVRTYLQQHLQLEAAHPPHPLPRVHNVPAVFQAVQEQALPPAPRNELPRDQLAESERHALQVPERAEQSGSALDGK